MNVIPSILPYGTSGQECDSGQPIIRTEPECFIQAPASPPSPPIPFFEKLFNNSPSTPPSASCFSQQQFNPPTPPVCSTGPINCNKSAVICAASPCPVILNAKCVFYEGPNLIYTQINTNDNLETAIKKINDKIENGGTATSVGISMPSAFNVTNSPVTGSGTIIITGAGSSSQIIRGDGSLGFPVTGITTLNAQTNLVQLFATGTSGTDFNISSSLGTHTFNIPVASASNTGKLSSADWTIFNNKQVAGNYITALTGEASASGPGSASVTLSNSAVIGKVLSGLNLTGGGTIVATDSILQAFGKIQNQLSALLGGVTYQGVWNASTNSPTLTSSVGTKGYYYIVSVAGSTNLNGITDWRIGDWAIFNGSTWDKVDNTDAVSSVNGFTGAVSLTTANISEVTNLYYTEARVNANANVAANTAARHNAVTIGTANGLSLSTQVLSLGLAGSGSTGALSSTDWNTFNNKAPSVAGGYLPLSGGTLTGGLVGTTGSFASGVTAQTGEFISGGQDGSVGSVVRISTTSTNANARNWGIVNTWDNFGDLTFRVSNAQGGNALSAGTSVMALLRSGNVGIGTTSPLSKLQVSSNFGKTDATNRTIAAFTSNDVSNPSRILFGITGAASQISRVATIQTDEFDVVSSGSLSLQPFGGNVGIGTTSPWDALSIPFDSKLSFGSSTYPLSISRSSAANLITTISDNYDVINTRIDFVMRNGSVNQNTPLSLLSTGNVGIGTINPQSKLEVLNNSEGEYFRGGGGTITDRSLRFSSFTVSGLTGVGHRLLVPNAFGQLVFSIGSTDVLFLASSGAATFSSSVTVADGLTVNGLFRGTVTTNRQTASYTLVLADNGKLIEMNVASANNLTVPLNSSVAFPIGTQIDVIQYGAGQTTIVATGGVTINSQSGYLKIGVRYSAATLIKIGTNEWYCIGNLVA